MHLFQHGIEKELERFNYINDDNIEELLPKLLIPLGNVIVDIKHLMLYQAMSYLDKAQYYAAILADMELNIKVDDTHINDITTEKEYVAELCDKINKNYIHYVSMIKKIGYPPTDKVLNKLITEKYNNINLIGSKYCIMPLRHDVAMDHQGGSKDNKRYKFYNAFLKEFKKSLKLK